MRCIQFMTIAYALIVLFMSDTRHADPTTKVSTDLQRPESLTVGVGDLVIRIDGPKMSIHGQSFRMERRSKIRAIDVESSLSLRDGVLIESARVRTEAAVDLRIAAAMMYAWSPTVTAYLFGDDQGLRNRGTFLPETAKPTEGGDKAARWMAVYDAPSGKGAVSYVMKQPPGAGTWLQFTDAPKVYRKMRLLFFGSSDSSVRGAFHGGFWEA